MLAVVGVQAQSAHNLYAVPTQVSGNGNISWNESDKKLTVTAQGSNTYQIFEFPAGSLADYTTLHINIDHANDRVLFMKGTEIAATWTSFGSTGSKNKTLSDLRSELSGLNTDFDIITSIRIGGPNGSETLSEYYINLDPTTTYLESSTFERMDITTSLTSTSTKDNPVQLYDSQSNAWSDASNNFQNHIGQSTGSNDVFFGHKNGSRTDVHFDLTGYDIFRVNLTTAGANQVRFFAIAEANDVNISTIANTNKYEYHNSDFTTCYNIKAQNGGTQSNINISSIDFVKEFKTSSTTDFSIAASTSSSVAYDRSFISGEKYTVCLPFAFTPGANDGTFYELTSASGGTLHFTPVEGATTAYKPYLYVAGSNTTPFANLTSTAIVASAGAATTYSVEDGTTTYTFNGTLAHVTVPVGAFGWSSNGIFSKVTSGGTGVTIDAFRGYITSSTGSPARLNVIFDDETSGIQSVNGSGVMVNGSEAMYNLQGQRVSENHKGLVIKNGKKVVIK